jgi:hypothetical protein
MLLAPLVAGLLVPAAVRAVEPAGGAREVPPAAWSTSPFHGVISGATGEPIPCRCRFKGGEAKLGETVCMETPLGVQLARCDLFLNNTSWVPLGVACTLSAYRHRQRPLESRCCVPRQSAGRAGG